MRPRPRRRPGESSQKEGGRFERFWASLFGVPPVRGSGNQWFAKMDVGDASILWSCKHTDTGSFRVDKALIREVENAINGPGGIGGNTIPGAAISVEGEAFVAMRAEDFLRLIAAEGARYVVPSKAEQKRSRSKIPNLLREDE